MPVTASGLFVDTFIGAFGAPQTAVDLSLLTNRVAMFTNAITPDFDAAGAGYAAGGTTVTGPTLTGASGTMTFDLDDTTWAASTISGARCALFYADALAGNNAICLINFGADYSTVAGAFTIQWPLTGMFAVDWTP